MCPGESRTAAGLDSTTGGLTALGVERYGTTDLPARRRAPSDPRGPLERTGGCVGSDLLERCPETVRRLEMSALTSLLCPKTSDAGSRDQEHDHDIDHALPPKTSLALFRDTGLLTRWLSG